MSDVITREIVGLTKISKWNKVKGFIKTVINKTLIKNAGYRLIALDAYINNNKKSELNFIIEKKEDLNRLNEISSFSNLSLYQRTKFSSNHINISQNNGIIVLIAKYMGSEVNNHQCFDFAVYIDPIHEPFFTDGSGQVFSCSEMLKRINENIKSKNKTTNSIKTKDKILKNVKAKTEKSKRKYGSKQKNEIEIKKIEASIYENLKRNNAIWGGNETKAFRSWKKKTANKYKKQTGKISYYRGKPTKNYTKYLEDLVKPKNKLSVLKLFKIPPFI